MKIETLFKILIVVLGLNFIISLVGVFKSPVDSDLMTIREHELKMKLHDADLKIEDWKSKDQKSTIKIKRYEDYINDNVFDGSSRAFRDSARNVLNPE